MNDKKADKLVQWAKAADDEENGGYVASDRHIEQAGGDLLDDLTEAAFIAETLTDDEVDRLHAMVEWRIRQAITHRQRFGIGPIGEPLPSEPKPARLRKLIRDWRMRAEPQAADYVSPISRCCAEEIVGCASELEDELEGR